ncbi:MAG: hypothetical protein QNJ46_24335 [Leptolyngbyaceae cyanobacterium MO_188.B28]|nr:hypothetical protein [Leptolyngbyaceae cyanobacterium MO_188.B28]
MMSKKKTVIPQKLRPWVEARRKYRLTHAQVQMAREFNGTDLREQKVEKGYKA